jgi:gas vesicle protein
MARKNVSKLGYVVGGLGVGSLIGILFAPKSGDETREYLTNKAKEGRGYAKKQARYIKERAEELVERSKEAVTAKKKQIATAVNLGREVYRSEHEWAKKVDRSPSPLRSSAGFYET